MSAFIIRVIPVLLNIMHVALNSLEDLLELVSFQRNNLVIVVDLLDVFDLFFLCLDFNSQYFFLDYLLIWVLIYHTLDKLILIISTHHSFEIKWTLSDQGINLANLLFVNNFFKGVFILRYFLVDDLRFDQVIKSILIILNLHKINCFNLRGVGLNFYLLECI